MVMIPKKQRNKNRSKGNNKKAPSALFFSLLHALKSHELGEILEDRQQERR